MTRLSHSQRHEIAKAYAEGEGPTAIGRRYGGLTCEHVIAIAKRAGVAMRQRRGPKPIPVIDEAPPPIEPKPAFPIRPEHVGAGQRHGAGYTKLM